jgi:hypothetical protein
MGSSEQRDFRSAHSCGSVKAHHWVIEGILLQVCMERFVSFEVWQRRIVGAKYWLSWNRSRYRKNIASPHSSDLRRRSHISAIKIVLAFICNASYQFREARGPQESSGSACGRCSLHWPSFWQVRLPAWMSSHWNSHFHAEQWSKFS